MVVKEIFLIEIAQKKLNSPFQTNKKVKVEIKIA